MVMTGAYSSASHQDIASDACTNAVSYLKTEFADKNDMSKWLESICSTSITDLMDTVCEAESRYLEQSKKRGGVMKWVGELSGVVMHYSNVLDVLTQHHPEYVSLVWGVTKFILMGVINHGNLVAQLSQALATMAEVLPRAKLTSELYNTADMKNALSNLYAHLLLFLKQALKWYNVGPAGRALSAIFRPFELNYGGTLREIEQCALTIDKIASLHVKLEVREIRNVSNEQAGKLVRIEDKLHQMQRWFESSHSGLNKDITKILDHLNVHGPKLDQIYLDMGSIKPRIYDMHFKNMVDILKPTIEPEQALQRHASIIRRSAPRSSRDPDEARIFLRISQWARSQKSPLLVLQTEPRAQSRVKRLAVEVIRLLKPQSNQVFWYLSSINPDDAAKASTAELIRTLIFQIMTIAPDVVTENANIFNAAKLLASHSDEEWFQLLLWSLQNIAACFIIIEAEDVMRNEGTGRTSEGLMTILQDMAYRVRESGHDIKLLVVSYHRYQVLIGSQATVIAIKRETPAARRRWRGRPPLNDHLRNQNRG